MHVAATVEKLYEVLGDRAREFTIRCLGSDPGINDDAVITVYKGRNLIGTILVQGNVYSTGSFDGTRILLQGGTTALLAASIG